MRCDLLKQLKDENEQLRSHLDYFKAKNGSLESGMFNLERENQQLRKENYGLLDGFAFYKEENASLSERISDLECEVERLKQELEMFHPVMYRDNRGTTILYRRGDIKWRR